ncbi:MAG: HAD-IIB family hydrolase [bacterium]|nr:HAD-IIB family hydrolase [bacterium]
MQCPRAVIFDLDDTLAESFQPPKHQMVTKLGLLLDRIPLAIMTAAGFTRIEDQFLSKLADSPYISRLYVFPNSTAECYVCESGKWHTAYSESLTKDERHAITVALQESLADTELFPAHPKHEPMIIDRDAQIAFATLGLDATLEEKQSWDPDQAKRKRLVAILEKKIPQFEILMGGMTTIDITRKNVNKAYGVRWLSTHLGIPANEMLYVGDALYEGGNDAVVMSTGIETRAVGGPDETERVIDELIVACSA